MYSTLDEIDEDQIDAHYSEFFNVMEFLNVCKRERIKFKEIWNNYSIELKEFDNCLPEKLIYDTIESIDISFPYFRFGQYCYVSNKLKEIEIRVQFRNLNT